jgi:hypothetical protein
MEPNPFRSKLINTNLTEEKKVVQKEGLFYCFLKTCPNYKCEQLPKGRKSVQSGLPESTRLLTISFFLFGATFFFFQIIFAVSQFQLFLSLKYDRQPIELHFLANIAFGYKST